VPFDRASLEAAGAVFASNPTYGTQYAFFPKGSPGIARALGGADMIIDETYYVGVPGLANISASLGFESPEDAAAAVPALAAGNIYRWEGGSGALGANWGGAAEGRRHLLSAVPPSPVPGVRGR
jgi:hypothetical protein